MTFKERFYRLIRINNDSYIDIDRVLLDELPEDEKLARIERDNNGFLSEEEFQANYQAWERGREHTTLKK